MLRRSTGPESALPTLSHQAAASVALGISVLLGLAGGFLLTKGVLWRVEAVTQTAEAIVAGDMTRRIEQTDAGLCNVVLWA